MAELNLGRVVGQDGERGEPGKSAYAYAQEAGFVGTEQEFSSNLAGINEKANKAPDAVEGNIATLDAEGNPTDSGKNLDEIGGKVPIVSSPPGDEKITFWLNTQVPLKDVPIIDPLEDIEHTVVSAMQYREQGTGETKTIPALSVKSAYQSAVEGGYIGTEEDFKKNLANIMPKSEIETQLSNKANKKLNWLELPLNPGFSRSGTAPKYSKDDFGFVHLLGFVITDSSSNVPPGEPFATLPSGFYPQGSIYLPVASVYNMAYGDGAVLKIQNGVLSIAPPHYTQDFAGGGVSLWGLSFWVG